MSIDYDRPATAFNPHKILCMQIESEILKQCWFLTGPTASGKTAVSLNWAERLEAEIVVMDSMTLYRGMDIGTAKATAEEQARVPHHLVDILDPHEEFTVAEYVTKADAVCREIINRGKVPMFVGGTGLYLRSLLRGVFEGPPADWELRKRLEREAETEGTQYLHQKLRNLDPETAERLHPNDQRRVIRALEVIEQTGQPLSAQQQQNPLPADDRPQHVYWLSPDREWLYERINRRVDLMIDEGLVDEVRGLLNAPQGLSRTARQALGYKEIIEHIEEGVPLTDAIETLKTRTRQFAKRQLTWFRGLEELKELKLSEAGEVVYPDDE
ncbi:tRNA (adenosine(37)-N6)-dimethylallyltransferase MiaA [Calycomorphotria hydatis]|uniref:tRNA dimethylallyltransferase n=1 Tax=Calycomorphotria hydatis TaxID=2528027 RepID=A0A517T450_9PLAN|nr:tRNA (adenosine(37)-N6)-dimethylallyltransferase MiaA [Calycomorphotria hydatis]QDT63153.1 IPP transferase [Calycomorphotria hydatis]